MNDNHAINDEEVEEVSGPVLNGKDLTLFDDAGRLIIRLCDKSNAEVDVRS